MMTDCEMVHEPDHSLRNGKIAFGKPEQWFALIATVVGFMFWRWLMIVFLAGFQGSGVTAFALVYAGVVSVYFRQVGIKQSREAKLWLGVLLITALSFAVWSAPSISPWRFIFLLGAATYWVVIASGNTVTGGTSDWSVRDLLNGVLVVPLAGLGLQMAALLSIPAPRFKVGRRMVPSLVGIGLGVLVAALVLPLLMAADAGGFSVISQWLARFDFDLEISGFLWAQLILGIPTAAYIFALLVGNAYRGRGRRGERAGKGVDAAMQYRVMPVATAVALLSVVNLLYATFILTQLPYFFAAFFGQLPQGWASYAEFARQGFFELCAVALINLALILGVHFTADISKATGTVARALLSLLPALTLVLVATAMSKLWLYVDQFGLTMMRVKPAAILLFLAVVFACLVVGDRARFSKMRVAVATGVAIMLALSWLNVEGRVANYNADRYLAGTLPHFDVAVLRAADVAGVEVALRLIAATDDIGLEAELRSFLRSVADRDASLLAMDDYGLGSTMWVDTLQRRLARAAASDLRTHVSLPEVVAWVARQPHPPTSLPLKALTYENRVLVVYDVLFPYVAMLEQQQQADTHSVWVVDLKSGDVLLGDYQVQGSPSVGIFGLSPSGTRLGLVLANVSRDAQHVSVGFVDLATQTPVIVSVTQATHGPIARPRWSPQGRFIYYGAEQPISSPAFTFGLVGEWWHDLNIGGTVSRAPAVQVTGRDLTPDLFPAPVVPIGDFYPWITNIVWETDETALQFTTVARLGVDSRQFQQAFDRQRVRQELGEARWRINADGTDLRLLEVHRPE
ncbi:MAG: hypothetical protein DDT36_01288 [Firmicutes bacterium]|nr:hypothetical protein [Bacillota bacterium]